MRILREGKTKSGDPFVIRYPESTDVQSVWEYINRLSKERTFVRFQGEEVPIEKEQKFIEDTLAKIADHKRVQLFLVVNEKVQGICGIDLHEKTESHVAVLGLSVDESLRGQGLGEMLLSTTIDEAARNLPGLRIITLKAKAPNKVAISLYEKLGFKKYGQLPLGTKHRDELVDELMMYKTIPN